MKTPSTELFELIKSLTKTEKRYFKRFATLHVKGKENNYVSLFDAIDKQKVYDEEKIKTKFAGKRFVTYLSTEKNYLYNLILKSLELYYSESIPKIQMNKMLSGIEILKKKGLYSHSWALIKKTKTFALNMEHHEVLSSLLRYELQTSRYVKIKEQEIEQIKKDQLKVIEELKNTTLYWHLENEIFKMYLKNGLPRKKQDLVPYKKIMQHNLLKEKKRFLCFTSHETYLYIHGLYSFISNDIPKSFKYAKLIVGMLEANEEKIKANPINYIFSIYNQSIGTTNYEETKNLIEKVRLINLSYSIKKQQPIETMIFLGSNTMELGLLNKLGEFEKATALIDKLLKKIKKNDNKEHEEWWSKLHIQIIKSYFGANEYKLALRWHNISFGSNTLHGIMEKDVFYRFFFLVLQFELENYSLKGFIQSTRRFLTINNKMGSMEKRILDFFENVPNQYSSKKELNLAFSMLLKDLTILKQDPLANRILRDFDYVSWAESKITGESFAAVVKRKYLANKSR